MGQVRTVHSRPCLVALAAFVLFTATPVTAAAQIKFCLGASDCNDANACTTDNCVFGVCVGEHRSSEVNRLPSSHAAPGGLAVCEQPRLGMHRSSVQGFPSLQSPPRLPRRRQGPIAPVTATVMERFRLQILCSL